MYAQSTAYSILELAVVPVGNSIPDTFKNALSLAQRAETLGYKRFWVSEHHNTISACSCAPPVLVGYLAAGTKTIRVGSGGVMLPNHSPLVVAEQFGTLASLYPDRIDLGIGRAPGTDQATALAIRSDFMEASKSFPGELDKIQRFFSPENATAPVRVTVAEGVDVPLYLLGASPGSARLAAQNGLPYAFASHFAAAQLFESLETYRNEFRPSAAQATSYAMAALNVVVADTDEQAGRMFTSLLRMFVDLKTGERDYLQPPTDFTDKVMSASKHPALQQMMKYTFVGSKARVKAQIEDFLQKTGVDEIIASTPVYNHKDRLRSYELLAEIMGELNAHGKSDQYVADHDRTLQAAAEAAVG